MYVLELLVIDIVPFTVTFITLYVSASPSTSEADNVPLYSISSLAVTVSADATGASFSALTVNVKPVVSKSSF